MVTPSNQPGSSKTHFDNLDALRFFAALGVITVHMAFWFEFPSTLFYKWLRIIISLDQESGNAGVSFFFTLSGFLITYLMYKEKAKTAGLSVKYFYFRRFLRIWPLYYVTVLIGFTIYPHIALVQPFHETADFTLYALFLANFDNPENGILRVLWSVAVEEQFYLIWPWVFLMANHKKYFHWVCLGLIAISMVYHISNGRQLNLFSALSDLAMGALMAYLAFYYAKGVQIFFQRSNMIVTFLMYVFGATLLCAHFQLSHRFPAYLTIDRLISSIFFAFVIMEQNFSQNSFFKFGRIKLFSWLGKISYGLYLFHMVALYFVLFVNTRIELTAIINMLLTILLTVLLSHVSYQYLESPFLRLKEKFST